MNEVMTMISTLGFPIVACIGLAYFCKYMLEACTEAINRLSDKLEDIK